MHEHVPLTRHRGFQRPLLVRSGTPFCEAVPWFHVPCLCSQGRYCIYFKHHWIHGSVHCECTRETKSIHAFAKQQTYTHVYCHDQTQTSLHVNIDPTANPGKRITENHIYSHGPRHARNPCFHISCTWVKA